MKTRRLIMMACGLIACLTTKAADYLTYLTAERGFTEVTTTDSITGSDDDYYILTAAENTQLIVGLGRYEAKPDWASTETKALRYRSADSDPVLDLSNFFTIEKSGQYIGLRNVVYSADMMQTHDNAGYMYVNTYTDKNFDEWSYLIPSFQDGYWTFENGKYPMSSENWACGYLGPWHDNVVADDALALNKRESAIGHYRLFRIAKTDLKATQIKQLMNANATNPLNATWLITNPSFETGDETGWTTINREDNNNEFKVCDYGMTYKDGLYLFNAFQWWGTNIGVTQTIDIPSGEYTLSGVVCTWADRIVYFIGNDKTINKTGIDDATGIPVSLDVNIGLNSKLNISAGSTAQWWVDGHKEETRTFFKLDNVQLVCKGLYLNGAALPLPNDNSTTLQAGQWYYYEAPYPSDYWLIGNINGMVYSTDGEKLLADISTAAVGHKMMLQKGRTYFKTTSSDATLQITPERAINESDNSFTACALNVDGLPNKILTIELNKDGPGSEGTKKISKYLSLKGYDFIGCSEDFNYHGSLISQLQDDYSWGEERATLNASGLSLSMLLNGFRFDTDGLNLLWKKSTSDAANESCTQWDSMAATDGNQYIKKGYRHYDMTIDNQTFDLYILHMDAGDNDEAIASRHSQWQQLAAAINSTDANRPKLVIGDTNSRWTREDIKANFIDKLNSNLTASDVWVEFYRDGIYPTTDMTDLTDQSDPWNFSNYEIVDKIIYINPTAPNTLQLVPQNFKIEQDYIYATVDDQPSDNGTPLGDHKPVVVEFKYMQSGDKLPIMKGDVNFDGKVTIADAVAIVNHLLGQTSVDYVEEAANVDGDQQVTVADAMEVAKIILGIP